MRGVRLCWVIAVGALALAGPASANWGENWGSMVWTAAPTPVPGLGLLGLGLLSLALAFGAAFSMRRRAWPMSIALVALAIPLAAVASPITGLNVFSNGTAADADEDGTISKDELLKYYTERAAQRGSGGGGRPGGGEGGRPGGDTTEDQ